MILTDLHPHGGIGANCILAEIGRFRVVVDAGLHPKIAGRDALPDFSALGGLPIDAAVLTHCHLDHLGAIPILMRLSPEAPLILSVPSEMLFQRMLHNSCRVMTRQRDELGLAEYPLFSHAEVERIRHRTYALAFGQTRTLSKGNEDLRITFFPAGHAPGAAAVVLEHRDRRLVFSGDCLFNPLRILKGGTLPTQPCQALVLETTRGDTQRLPAADRESEIERFLLTVAGVLERGGAALIPAFAFGRMQEMIAILREGRSSRLLPRSPIYASGLGMDLADYFDQITRRTSLLSFRSSFIRDLGIKPLPPELAPGKPISRPAIYLLSSGMVVPNTPSYNVAAGLIDNPRHALLFVGYCDPETPGGRLLSAPRGDPFLFGQLDVVRPLLAEVERFDLSCHADREELVNYAQQTRASTVFLTHGDPPARQWFRQALSSGASSPCVIDPEPLVPYPV